MNAFDIIQMRWVVVALGGGLILTLLILLGFYGRSLRDKPPEPGSDEGGFRAPHAVPWFLVLVWVALGSFVILYTVYVAAGRTQF
jgi:hypothetical protein